MEKVWLLNRVCLALLVGLYGWSMRFNLEVRVRIGTLTMQSYMVVLLFYLLAVLGIRKRGPICRDGIFELALILQIFVTVGYWLMVHRQLILSSGFSQEVIIWNIFIHILPLLCLTGTQLLEPVAFKNRLVPLAFFVFGLAFPLNYVFTIYDGPLYPPPLHYTNFFDGFVLAIICYLVLAAFSSLLWFTTKYLKVASEKEE